MLLCLPESQHVLHDRFFLGIIHSYVFRASSSVSSSVRHQPVTLLPAQMNVKFCIVNKVASSTFADTAIYVGQLLAPHLHACVGRLRAGGIIGKSTRVRLNIMDVLVVVHNWRIDSRFSLNSSGWLTDIKM